MKLLSVMLLCAACSPKKFTATPSLLYGTVHATLGDSSHNVAAANLQLTPNGALASEGDFHAVAALDGTYSFGNLPSGSYVLSASVPSTIEGTVSESVDVSGTTKATDLVLAPAGSITGIITVSGVPAGGARVSLDDTTLVAATDDNGRFLLSHVGVGAVRLRAEKVDVAGGRLLRNLTIDYDHTTDIGALDITPGVSANFNHPPAFAADSITLTPFQAAVGTQMTPLPIDLAANEAGRYDTITLHATAADADGDTVSYFWSVDAGTLDHTDTDTVHWSVDSATANQATLAVRVTDDRSGANQLTSVVNIVDLQTLSADFNGASAVYAYRRFGGTFRILQYDFASAALSAIADVPSLDDPQPILVGDYIHFVADPDGSTHHYFVQPGGTASERTPGGDEVGVAGNGRLVQSKLVGGVRVGWAYDPVKDSSSVLFNCGPIDCGNVVSSDGMHTVFVSRETGIDIFLYDTGSQTLDHVNEVSNVGASVLGDATQTVFADVIPGDERGERNDVILQDMTGLGGKQVYSGAYSVLIGAFDGDAFGFSEQSYREILAPETSFFFRISTGLRSSADTDLATNTLFAYDQVQRIANSTAVVRRYSRADWLKAANLTHYQLGTVPVP